MDSIPLLSPNVNLCACRATTGIDPNQAVVKDHPNSLIYSLTSAEAKAVDLNDLLRSASQLSPA
jgi:hypothetical protein